MDFQQAIDLGFDAVKAYVDRGFAELYAEVTSLKERQPARGERGEPGTPGRDAEPVTRDAILAAIAADPSLIDEAVAKHLTANPPPAGRDGVDGVRGPIGERGEKGEPGQPADPAEMQRAIAEAVAAIPLPLDGKSVSVDDVKPLIEETVRAAVMALPSPKHVTEALIDRDGNLVLALSDGSTKELGRVVGKDGSPGVDGTPGRDGVDGQAGPAGQKGDAGERGESGEPGLPGDCGEKGDPGRDGFGFDDLSVELVGERTIMLRFARGDVVKEFPIDIPMVIDRGVWRDGEFKRGDGVTWAGSFWIAQKDTADKPETSSAWRLAVKRGRDGKDGKPGAPGPAGQKGDRGEPGPRGFGG